MSVGKSSNLNTSSYKFFKSNPSSTSDDFSNGSPSNTFSKLLFDLFSISLETKILFFLNSIIDGIKKEANIIIKLLNTV